MRMKANYVEKPGNFIMDDWQIEKVVELSYEEFSELKTTPCQPQPFIAENKNCMFHKDSIIHGLLALGQGCHDGILIDTEGYGYARIAAYVPGARDIVNAELDRVVARIIQEAVEHTSDGNWQISFDTLENQFGLNVRVGSGFDKMLFDKLSARKEMFSMRLGPDHIDMTCLLNYCANLEEPPVKSLADFPEERRAALLDNAVGVALEIYEGEELYTMLHDSFGLAIHEIRDLGYLSDKTMADICHVPQDVLKGDLRVRDVLQMDGITDRAAIMHKDSTVLVRLGDLKELTGSGQEEFSTLLDARVADVTVDFDVPQLRLGGVEPGELERFYDALESHRQAEQAMGPTM